jgi:hypothetical protein
MLLKEYQVLVENEIMHYERAHDTYGYTHPLDILNDFNQYRYAMILVLKGYLDEYLFDAVDVLNIDDTTYQIEWEYPDWSGDFDAVRQEFVRIILEIMDTDDSVSLPALAWSNHLQHVDGTLLQDHGSYFVGLDREAIDNVSQMSLDVVFPDIF